MARFVTSLAIPWAPVCSEALCTASVILRVVTVASAATAATLTAKIAAGALRGLPRNTVLEQVITGLALTLFGLFLHLIFWHELEGLVVFRIEAECGLRPDPCLKLGIEGKVVIAFSDRSADLQT